MSSKLYTNKTRSGGNKINKKMKTEEYEELLNEFIKIEKEKFRSGSGDDMFYEEQVIDYVDKQRPFWIIFIKFIEEKIKNG